jgi:hypothetical protein
MTGVTIRSRSLALPLVGRFDDNVRKPASIDTDIYEVSQIVGDSTGGAGFSLGVPFGEGFSPAGP